MLKTCFKMFHCQIYKCHLSHISNLFIDPSCSEERNTNLSSEKLFYKITYQFMYSCVVFIHVTIWCFPGHIIQSQRASEKGQVDGPPRISVIVTDRWECTGDGCDFRCTKGTKLVDFIVSFSIIIIIL